MSIQARLSTFDTTMVVVSLVIGVGIFRTPAEVARQAGSTELFFVVWVLGGLISLCGALTFAELGARFPRPGAYYEVVADCYGRGLAFVLNYAGLLLVAATGMAAVATTGVEYLLTGLRGAVPEQWEVSAGSLAVIAGLTGLNYVGVRTGARTQNLLSGLKIGLMLLFSAAALMLAGTGDAAATAPAAVSGPGSGLVTAGLGAALIPVFFSFGGYQTTINLGADVREGGRNLARAILAGFAVILAMYLLINYAYYAALGYEGIVRSNLVAAAVAERLFGAQGGRWVSLGVGVSAIGFVNAMLMQAPRAYYAMAADGVLPPIFLRVDSRTQAQRFTLLFVAATVVLALLLFKRFERMVNAVIVFDVLIIAITASTLFVLRRRAARAGDVAAGDGPGGSAAAGMAAGGFRMPGYPWVPGLFVVFLLGVWGQAVWHAPQEALLGALVLLAGWPLFAVLRWWVPHASQPVG